MRKSAEITIEKIKNDDDWFNKARMLRHLIDEEGMRIIDLAKALGVKESYICHILRLNRLPEIIVDGYYSKLVSLSHLFIVSRIKNESKMIEVYEKILSGNLTVIQTQDLVREVLYSVKPGGERITEEEKENFIKKMMEKNKNLKIQMIQTRIKGRLELEYKGNLKTTSSALREVMDRLR